MRTSRISTLMAMLLTAFVGMSLVGCQRTDSDQQASRDQLRSEQPGKQSMAPSAPGSYSSESPMTAGAKPDQGSVADKDSSSGAASTQPAEKTGPMATPSEERPKDASKKEPS